MENYSAGSKIQSETRRHDNNNVDGNDRKSITKFIHLCGFFKKMGLSNTNQSSQLNFDDRMRGSLLKKQGLNLEGGKVDGFLCNDINNPGSNADARMMKNQR